MAQSQPVSLTSIGLDIGKEVFHLVGFDAQGAVALRRKIKRAAFEREFEKLPRCIVGMEACLSAHFVSRTTASIGARAEDHPCDLREALREGSEERLQRR